MVYQLIAHLVRPFTALYLLLLVSAVCMWWRRVELRKSLRWVILLLLILGLMSNNFVAYLACGTLEWRYPPRRDLPDDAQAVVTLGGSVRLLDPAGDKVEPGRDSMYRCVLAAELYHQRPDGLPIFVCGGHVNPGEKGPTYAACMAEFLVKMGVPRDDIVLEDRSRTTQENVDNVQRLLRDRGIDRIVLVTDATHLLRSERCFRGTHITVYPRGAYYRAGAPFEFHFTDLLPSSRALRKMDVVAHEWVGMAWYWVKDRN